MEMHGDGETWTEKYKVRERCKEIDRWMDAGSGGGVCGRDPQRGREGAGGGRSRCRCRCRWGWRQAGVVAGVAVCMSAWLKVVKFVFVSQRQSYDF